MSKILKNQTLSPITIADLGLDIPASPTIFTVHPNEYPLFASSSNLATEITNGNIKVNDGYDDLDSVTGLKHIQQESVPRDTSLLTALNSQPTANSNLSLTNSSRLVYIFTGTTAGQIITLPSALTITQGHRFQFWNTSTQNILIKDNTATLLTTLIPNRRVEFVLKTSGTQAGKWISDANIFTGVADNLSRFTASCGFDGSATSGRYLEFNSNVDSNLSGFVLPRITLLKEIAFAIVSNSAVTFNIYKFSGGVETSLTSISTTSGQRVTSVTGLNISFAVNDEIRVKCTAGTGARPVMSLFMVYN